MNLTCGAPIRLRLILHGNRVGPHSPEKQSAARMFDGLLEGVQIGAAWEG